MVDQIPRTRLQAERMKRQWTQAEIAKKIEIDVKTFSRWERGEQIAVPLMRRKLSSLFGETVDNSWFRHLEMMEELSSQFWNVPYTSNPFFTDNEQRVQHLRELLTGDGVRIPQVSISGMGGIGKTQLALAYAHAYRKDYEAVLWVRAGTQAQIAEGLVRIAYLLGVPETKKDEPKQQYLINDVFHWLRTHDKWLFIMDNVEEDLDEETPDKKENMREKDRGSLEDDLKVKHLLVMLQHGHILFTTRAQSIANLAQNCLLDVLQLEEGTQLFLHRSNLLSLFAIQQMNESALYKEALTLTQFLGGLPLAIEQAAAYIQETGCSVAAYQQLYEMSRKEILQSKIKYKRLYTDYDESVATTWLISFRRIEQQSVVASDVLKIFAYLAPDFIPEDLILKGAHSLNSSLHELAGNTYQFDVTLQVLLNYSLIKRFSQTAALSIHQLVQAVLQDNMDEETQRFWAEQAVYAVENVFSSSAPHMWQFNTHYLQQAQACIKHIEQWNLQSEEAAHLTQLVGYNLQERDLYREARPLSLQAMKMYEHLFGPNHPEVLKTLAHIVQLYTNMGNKARAEYYYHLFRERGGSDPLQQRMDLIFDCLERKDIDGALVLCQSMLKNDAWVNTYDPIYMSTIHNILAGIYTYKGKAELVEFHYRQEQSLLIKKFGENHPMVWKSLRDMARNYVYLNDLPQAEVIIEQALKGLKETIGPQHSEVAYALEVLVEISMKKGDYQQAAELYQQSLKIKKQISELNTTEPHR